MDDDGKLFWPSLYARLCPSRYAPGGFVEIEPEGEDEGADDSALGAFFIDLETLRLHVRIDLTSLLNARSLESVMLARAYGGDPLGAGGTEQLLKPYPNVQTSVLNYGPPAFIGLDATGLSPAQVEARLRRMLEAFEPRLNAQSLMVRVSTEDDPDEPLRFEIEGEIRALDVDAGLRVLITSRWDPDEVRSDVDMTTV